MVVMAGDRPGLNWPELLTFAVMLPLLKNALPLLIVNVPPPEMNPGDTFLNVPVKLKLCPAATLNELLLTYKPPLLLKVVLTLMLTVPRLLRSALICRGPLRPAFTLMIPE